MWAARIDHACVLAAKPATALSRSRPLCDERTLTLLVPLLSDACAQVAVRMNLLNLGKEHPTKPPGLVKFTRQIVQSEGVLSLYNGLGAGITRQVCCCGKCACAWASLKLASPLYKVADRLC